ncbi:hypothetical protein P152DRAFT_129562 [Eremomyces bilateralis CBS 781.70]|uniref:Uncharacterized protein n=1 Tax=Eremomyces bilateralis CBS 781.70 TaxID=1392243 RepID=A0A6G1GFH3_9PEZI|nr:uncharacterized protein P152DRAFT_129562 [Eremomyces bilateralis CBS 781.70]KAF1816600.1 hypothetical protein P152DRAFT_129562 [Eremomyces bilateralis CBS 781.70]
MVRYSPSVMVSSLQVASLLPDSQSGLALQSGHEKTKPLDMSLGTVPERGICTNRRLPFLNYGVAPSGGGGIHQDSSRETSW